MEDVKIKWKKINVFGLTQWMGAEKDNNNAASLHELNIMYRITDAKKNYLSPL